MKRFRHFAGDGAANAPFQLPFACRWVRVTDFNLLGAIDTNATQRSFERATMRLDNKDPVLVTGYSGYSRDLPGDYFHEMELTGDIEVEAGEYGDAYPGPVISAPQDIPLSMSLMVTGNTYKVLLPKQIGRLSLAFFMINGTPQIQSLTVSPIYMQNGTVQGLLTPWRPGPVWQGLDNPNKTFAANPLFTWASPPFATSLVLHLLPGLQSYNDDVHFVYGRPWAPMAGLAIFVSTNDGTSMNMLGHATSF